MSKAKTIVKKTLKWVLIIVLVMAFLVAIGYFLMGYLERSGIIDIREYEYVDGESNTKYVPKNLNSLIDEMDRFVKEIESAEGGKDVQNRGNNIK
jgi:hypothetical protein